MRHSWEKGAAPGAGRGSGGALCASRSARRGFCAHVCSGEDVPFSRHVALHADSARRRRARLPPLLPGGLWSAPRLRGTGPPMCWGRGAGAEPPCSPRGFRRSASGPGAPQARLPCAGPTSHPLPLRISFGGNLSGAKPRGLESPDSPLGFHVRFVLFLRGSDFW